MNDQKIFSNFSKQILALAKDVDKSLDCQIEEARMITYNKNKKTKPLGRR